MSYFKWLKAVRDYVVLNGYSLYYADAISLVVRGYYIDRNNYLDPIEAGKRGLYPPLYIKKISIWFTH